MSTTKAAIMAKNNDDDEDHDDLDIRQKTCIKHNNQHALSALEELAHKKRVKRHKYIMNSYTQCQSI